PPTRGASGQVFQRIERQVYNCAAGAAGTPRSNARNQHLGIHHNRHYTGERHAQFGENLVQLSSLLTRTRIAVKQNALLTSVQIVEFFFTMSPINSSGTRFPSRINPAASLPSSVLLRISSRRI